MLNIALPKGRLGDKAYRIFRDCGYLCPAMERDDRRLVLPDEDGRVQYLLVKPSDVPIYVEHGAADVGVVGKDVLLEGGNDVYELLDWASACAECAWPRPWASGKTRRAAARGNQVPRHRQKVLRGQEPGDRSDQVNGSIELAPSWGCPM
jgi:ATP phosphoribosyltransferase